MAMAVGILAFELHLPGARSLKEKRKVIKSLMDRLQSRYRVSVAETDHHDLHQRAEIGVALVGTRAHEVERMLEALRELAESDPEAFVTRWDPQILESEP
jgi:hypothetical protein